MKFGSELLLGAVVSLAGLVGAQIISIGPVTRVALFSNPRAMVPWDASMSRGVQIVRTETVGSIQIREWSVPANWNGKLGVNATEEDVLVERQEGGADAHIDLGSAPRCNTECGFYNNLHASNSDCTALYNEMYRRNVAFTINQNAIIQWKANSCAAYWVNLSPDSIGYNFRDSGGVAQWLNGECLQNQWQSMGMCRFERWTNYANGFYLAVGHVNYFPPL